MRGETPGVLAAEREDMSRDTVTANVTEYRDRGSKEDGQGKDSSAPAGFRHRAHRSEREVHRADGAEGGVKGLGPHPASHEDQQVHGPALAARAQEVA